MDTAQEEAAALICSFMMRSSNCDCEETILYNLKLYNDVIPNIIHVWKVDFFKSQVDLP